MGKAQSARAIVNFSTGEIAPVWAGQANDERTRSGARTMRNFTLAIYGSADRRAGFQFVSYSYETTPATPGTNSPLSVQSQVHEEFSLVPLALEPFL